MPKSKKVSGAAKKPPVDISEVCENSITVNGSPYDVEGLIDSYYGAPVGFPGILFCIGRHLGFNSPTPMDNIFYVIGKAFERVKSVEVENTGESFDLSKYEVESEVPYHWHWEDVPHLRLKVELR